MHLTFAIYLVITGKTFFHIFHVFMKCTVQVYVDKVFKLISFVYIIMDLSIISYKCIIEVHIDKVANLSQWVIMKKIWLETICCTKIYVMLE